MMVISFIIPCYGSENTIEYVVSETIEVVAQRSEFDYEIICVNDASPDNVLRVLHRIAESNNRVKVVDLAKNFGKHSAVMAGFSLAKGDFVVNLDDDGQCPMDRLWDLVDPLLEDKADMTMAEYPKKKQSAFKNFGSHVNSLMSRTLINKPKELQFSNFSVMKAYMVQEIIKYDNPYPYLEGLILRTTNRIMGVKMEERERVAGQGHFTFMRSLRLWINGFTAFSVVPLRVSTLIGMICALIGFIYGVIVVIRKILIPDISAGWSSTVAIILFVGGIIMLLLGMIGEYIGRIYISINNSPQYVIRETINIDEDMDD